MKEHYGPPLDRWDYWSNRVGRYPHMLPVVCNPDAKISEQSNMKALGKTPSQYNFRGEVSGFAKWTQHEALMREISRWETNPDYGICIQTRALRAIDIDVPGIKRSRKIQEFIENHFPLERWPVRYREHTGKCLMPFRLEEPLTKRVLPVDGGMIEILGDGQQFIAEGTYLKDGRADGRYMWRRLPTELDGFPLITLEELDELCEALEMIFGTGDGWNIARQRTPRDTSKGPLPGVDDPVANWIAQEYGTLGEGPVGELYIECPFKDQHSMDSGPSETAYFPAGTGGFDQGHVKCLHAGCQNKSDGEMLEAMGYQALKPEDFPELPAEPESKEIEKAPEVRWFVDKQGRKENREYNITQFLLDPEMSGMHIAWDDFSAQVVWCPAGDAEREERWALFSDEHYVILCERMDRHGFVPVKPAGIRPTVYRVAQKHKVDLAIEWAERLPEWDGLDRITGFWAVYGGAEKGAYIDAVSHYTWTALAGRVLDPGCQADMVPILVSPQGTRKTSFVAALAPTRDWFTDVNLTQRDDDMSRKMRGKAVIELDELRGLQGRAVEDVKSFVTRREEEWVPKYQEFTKTFKRRFIMFGTTNRDDFLGDPTGERRYLPMEVGVFRKLDVEQLEADRDQLWAQAKVLFEKRGVLWQDAERLAVAEHVKYKSSDPWTALVVDWLKDDQAMMSFNGAPVDNPWLWTSDDIIFGAGLATKQQINRGHQMRMSNILHGLGAVKRKKRGVGWGWKITRKQLGIQESEAEDELLS